MTTELVDHKAERPRLMSLAYHLLGTVADAEDAVQEAMSRFYALPDHQREAVESPGAWLMRVTGRVALDQLKSARRKRELYVGEWLPEPVPDAAGREAVGGPEGLSLLQAEVSYGVLVLLEQLSPAERAVFVLRESFDFPFAEISEVVRRSPGACRQLASEARRKVSAEDALRGVAGGEHTRIVRAFSEACATGNVQELTRLLDPSVAMRSDGGGVVSAARRPVLSADHVGRFLLGLRQKYAEAQVDLVQLAAGEQGVLLRLSGEVAGVLACRTDGGSIQEIWIMRNPEKLRLWV